MLILGDRNTSHCPIKKIHKRYCIENVAEKRNAFKNTDKPAVVAH